MSAIAVELTRPAGAVLGSPELAIARRAFAQLRLGAAILALVSGGSFYVTARAYATTYPTQLSREQAAALVSSQSGLRILLGPISDIATVGGYTVYKNFVFLTSTGAIWALLVGTRVLRGEEDAGRWHLVLAGSTRPARATLATLAALALAVGVIFAGTTVFALVATRDPQLGLSMPDSVLYGLSLALVPAVFATVGTFTSQLARTRRGATALALVVFFVSLALRMIADAGPGTRWLLWATPFGWTELMRPFTQNNAWPLLPAAFAVLILGGASAALASRRDVGDGLLAGHDVRPPRSFGLSSAFALSTRLELPVLIAWGIGAAVSGLAFGILARITTGDLPDTLKDNLVKYGVHGSFVSQFLGIGFLLIATVVALLPAGQVGAASAEETSGRLGHVLSGPTRRSNWFLGRLVLSIVTIVGAGLLGGLGTWVGARFQGLDLGLMTMLGAGLNVIPTALVALGIGAVVLSVAPRVASVSVYSVVIWSVFVDLLAPLMPGIAWADRLSLFHYMALVPGQDADPGTVAVTAALGIVLCVAATVVFDRRDLRSI